MKIKGFDKNLCCRGMQFEVGKVYDTGAKDDEIELCSDTVFHYCDSLQKVHIRYNCNSDNRFCEIEVLGAEVTDDKKSGSNKIKIVREIVGEELDILKGLINGNTGIFNSGDHNSGHHNSGDFNSCSYSSGFFCTIEPKARIFNIDTDMTVSEFYRSKYYDALCSVPFELTKWLEYGEEEKKEDENKQKIGGYLKEYTYKEACANWWSDMSKENKKIILSMPNFDKEIFKEITGIEVK